MFLTRPKPRPNMYNYLVISHCAKRTPVRPGHSCNTGVAGPNRVRLFSEQQIAFWGCCDPKIGMGRGVQRLWKKPIHGELILPSDVNLPIGYRRYAKTHRQPALVSVTR